MNLKFPGGVLKYREFKLPWFLENCSMPYYQGKKKYLIKQFGYLSEKIFKYIFA